MQPTVFLHLIDWWWIIASWKLLKKIHIFIKCVFVFKLFILLNTCLISKRYMDCSEEILDTPEIFYIKYMRGTFCKDPVSCQNCTIIIPDIRYLSILYIFYSWQKSDDLLDGEYALFCKQNLFLNKRPRFTASDKIFYCSQSVRRRCCEMHYC